MDVDLLLIGGCGSSGTTLLAHLLDGLEDMRSGPELGAFHLRELFTSDDFRRTLYRVLAGGGAGSSVGVDRLEVPLVPPVFLMERGFWGLDDLEQEFDFFEKSSDPPSMLQALREALARRQGIERPFLLVEQTPKNAVAAREALEALPTARFVHLIRDGRDVVASLAKRWAGEAPGHPRSTYLTAAAVTWCYDVSRARRALDHPHYLEVRYEQLVRDPRAALGTILEHVGRGAGGPIADVPAGSPSRAVAGDAMQGGSKPTWTLRPDAVVSDRAVGRYRRDLEPGELAGLMRFAFDDPDESGTRYEFADLLDALGYAAAPTTDEAA